MNRAIIYCRVSSDAAGQGRSVEEQEMECRAMCEREGWDVAEVLVDNDIGASRHTGKERPQYRRLREVLQAGDILVTWAASRAQRDLEAYVQLRTLCVEREVRWCYSGRVYDLSKGDDRMSTGLQALIDEQASENIRDAVLRASRANAREGKAHGPVVYGYRGVRDPDTGKIVQRVPDETQAPIVREAASRFLAGETLFSIALDFTRRGVPCARSAPRWRSSIVGLMLKTPTYAGLRSHHGVITQGKWEPILSVEDHQRIVALLSDPARVKHRGTAPKHLLAGIAKCGGCGDRMVATCTSKSTSKSYRCKDRGCTSRKMEPVDMMVTEALLRRLETMSGLEDIADPKVSEALRSARDLRSRIEDATDKFSDGELSAASLARIEAKLLPKIREAERQAQHTVSPHVVDLLGPGARGVWKQMSVVRRREVVRSLISVTIHKSPRTGKVFRPEFVSVEWL